MPQTFTKAEVEALESINLGSIAIVMPNTTRGDGKPIDLSKVVIEFQNEFNAVLDAVKNNKKLPLSFFIPDLWHVAKGRAVSLSPKEGDELWDMNVKAKGLANTFYKIADVSDYEQYAYPGAVHREPLAKPRYAL